MDICMLRGVGTAYGEKVVLDGVSVVLPAGAKVGVVGSNGAGKSTLLRIMAGLDRPTSEETYTAAGTVVGFLEQEPRLDEEATVRENVEQAVAGVRSMLDHFAQVTAQLGEAVGERTGRLLDELGTLQDTLDAPVRPLSAVSAAGWRCAGCCSPSRTCCCWTSPPTTSMPSRWPGWSSTSSPSPARS
jgi:ATPase subunit of ABC transporter with duplicated ATPase domains